MYNVDNSNFIITMLMDKTKIIKIILTCVIYGLARRLNQRIWK